MKFLWLVVIVLASCKAVSVYHSAANEEQRTDNMIEITFFNVGSNYSAVVRAIQKNGFDPQIQYNSTNVYQPLLTLSFLCCDMTRENLMHLKKAIASCNGVVILEDTVVNQTIIH